MPTYIIREYPKISTLHSKNDNTTLKCEHYKLYLLYIYIYINENQNI